ncbi:MAG: ABC transporter permease, partial [Planctomycetota bacterium]
MTGTLVRIGWLSLKRDRVAMGLTFVLPIVFFSIFALIFGGMGDAAGGGTEGVPVLLTDLDESEASTRLATALEEDPVLSVFPGGRSAEEAWKKVRRGEAPVAVVIPAGFGERFGDLPGLGSEAASIELVYDESDPVARQIVAGMLQKAVMAAAPDLMMNRGVKMLEEFGGELTDAQRAAVETARTMMRRGGAGEGSAPAGAFEGPVRVEMTNVRDLEGDEDEGSGGAMVAYYAAGIGVMFLLFSMAGAASTLLEEEENGTLERVLASHVGMGRLLAARWLFFALVGTAQVAVMFVWGALAFGLDLWEPNHLFGFLVMAVFTASAAAAFGICLATICRTRSQLGGMSTIVILIMSALGGSMVPRFVMPDFMNT